MDATIRKFLLSKSFIIHGILGRGGFGVVYDAQCCKSGAPVAVKVMSKDTPLGSSRVVSEVSLHLRACSPPHANVVGLLDFFEDAGYVYLVMERANHGDVYQWAQAAEQQGRGPLGLEVGRTLARQLLQALAHLHSLGIMHRDLKLSNLLLHMDEVSGGGNSSSDTSSISSPPRLLLCDFGMAARTVRVGSLSPSPALPLDTTSVSELVEHRTVCGTPAYLAPEVCLALPHDSSADMFSVGALVYTMVIGKAPKTREGGVAGCGGVGGEREVQYAHEFYSNLATLPPSAASFIQALLAPNPLQRLTAEQALCHPFMAWEGGEGGGSITGLGAGSILNITGDSSSSRGGGGSSLWDTFAHREREAGNAFEGKGEGGEEDEKGDFSEDGEGEGEPVQGGGREEAIGEEGGYRDWEEGGSYGGVDELHTWDGGNGAVDDDGDDYRGGGGGGRQVGRGAEYESDGKRPPSPLLAPCSLSPHRTPPHRRPHRSSIAHLSPGCASVVEGSSLLVPTPTFNAPTSTTSSRSTTTTTTTTAAADATPDHRTPPMHLTRTPPITRRASSTPRGVALTTQGSKSPHVRRVTMVATPPPPRGRGLVGRSRPILSTTNTTTSTFTSAPSISISSSNSVREGRASLNTVPAFPLKSTNSPSSSSSSSSSSVGLIAPMANWRSFFAQSPKLFSNPSPHFRSSPTPRDLMDGGGGDDRDEDGGVFFPPYPKGALQRNITPTTSTPYSIPRRHHQQHLSHHQILANLPPAPSPFLEAPSIHLPAIHYPTIMSSDTEGEEEGGEEGTETRVVAVAIKPSVEAHRRQPSIPPTLPPIEEKVGGAEVGVVGERMASPNPSLTPSDLPDTTAPATATVTAPVSASRSPVEILRDPPLPTTILRPKPSSNVVGGVLLESMSEELLSSSELLTYPGMSRDPSLSRLGDGQVGDSERWGGVGGTSTNSSGGGGGGDGGSFYLQPHHQDPPAVYATTASGVSGGGTVAGAGGGGIFDGPHTLRPFTPFSQALANLAFVESEQRGREASEEGAVSLLAAAAQERALDNAHTVQSFHNGGDSGAAAVLASIGRRVIAPGEQGVGGLPVGNRGLLSTASSTGAGHGGGGGGGGVGGGMRVVGNRSVSAASTHSGPNNSGSNGSGATQPSAYPYEDAWGGSSSSGSVKSFSGNSTLSMGTHHQGWGGKEESPPVAPHLKGLVPLATHRIPPVTVRVKDGCGEVVTLVLSPSTPPLQPSVLAHGLVNLFPSSPSAANPVGGVEAASSPVRMRVRMHWHPSQPHAVRLECKSVGGGGGDTLHVATYPLLSIPTPYHSLYRLVEATVRALRARTPKLAIVSPDVTAVVMEDGPKPTLEITARVPRVPGKTLAQGGWKKWQLTYRLRDHRLLVIPPPASGGPIACYLKPPPTAGAGAASSLPPTSSSNNPSVSVLHPSELPPHILALYVVAMRALPQCLALERSVTQPERDIQYPVVVRQYQYWLDEATLGALRGEHTGVAGPPQGGGGRKVAQ